MIYIELFYTFFIIGIFTFGGGYAMLSLIQDQIVVEQGWITAEQFTDIVAISQMTPGPIGINSATYVGYTVTGNIFGSFLATFAITLPSFIIVLSICKIYTRFNKSIFFEALLKYLKPVVIGMIAAAAGILITKENFIDWKSWALFAGAFICAQWIKLNPIIILVIGGVLGYFIY